MRSINYDNAVVLEFGDRFLHGFTADGRAQFAWCIAGSRLFGSWREDEIQAAEGRLKRKGYTPRRRIIALQPENR